MANEILKTKAATAKAENETKMKFALKLNENIIICEFAGIVSLILAANLQKYSERQIGVCVRNPILTNFRCFSLGQHSTRGHRKTHTHYKWSFWVCSTARKCNLRRKSLCGCCFAKLYRRWHSHSLTHSVGLDGKHTWIIYAINFIKSSLAAFRFRQILLLHIIIWFYFCSLSPSSLSSSSSSS